MPALQRVRARVGLGALLALVWVVPAAAQGGLDFPRQLYNQGRYDQAITAAGRLRATTHADGANLIIGRSHLERFRKTADPADLAAGRAALQAVTPANLAARDRLDYLVGLGESLYLVEAYGPAAELFESALDRGRELGPRAGDRVFDWWATSVDRHAQSGAVDDQESLYRAIRDQARAELARNPGSASATYWHVVSLRSLGDLTKAWDAAVAGWVRAPMGDDRARALRDDLDQLVLEALIPERVRASSERERERVDASLRASWEAVKRDWPTK